MKRHAVGKMLLATAGVSNTFWTRDHIRHNTMLRGPDRLMVLIGVSCLGIWDVKICITHQTFLIRHAKKCQKLGGTNICNASYNMMLRGPDRLMGSTRVP